MLASIFGTLKPATTLILVLYAILLSCAFLFFIHPLDNTLQFTIFSVELKAWVKWILVPIVVAGLAYGYQWLYHYHSKLVDNNAYLPYFFVILLLVTLGHQPVLGIIISVLLFVQQVFWMHINKTKTPLGLALNTGLLVGLATLVHPSFILLLPINLFVYIVYGTFNLRNLFIILAGVATPWIYVIALNYLLPKAIFTWVDFIALPQFKHVFRLQEWRLLTGFVPLAAIGIFTFLIRFNRAKVFHRQSFLLFALTLALGVVVHTFFGENIWPLALLSPFIALFFTYYLERLKRKWLVETWLWVVPVLFAVLRYSTI